MMGLELKGNRARYLLVSTARQFFKILGRARGRDPLLLLVGSLRMLYVKKDDGL